MRLLLLRLLSLWGQTRPLPWLLRLLSLWLLSLGLLPLLLRLQGPYGALWGPTGAGVICAQVICTQPPWD